MSSGDPDLDQPAELRWIQGEHSSAAASWGEQQRRFPTLREAIRFARTSLPGDARGPFITTASGRVLRQDDIGVEGPDLKPGSA